MENLREYKYKKAKERVGHIKGFYSSLLAYSIVIPLLAYFNYSTSSYPWVIFPAIGWGIGLIFCGLKAFGYHPFFGKDWEERKIREFMEKDSL